MRRSSQAVPIDEIFLDDVRLGLSPPRPGKTLPCKYLYDEIGSQLFDRICETPEYYPTRTEMGIIEANVSSIADQIGQRVMLVEYGSGSSLKTRRILDALDDPAAYVPVDISEEHLLKTADRLRSAYPHVTISPRVADFTAPFVLPAVDCDYSHIALYFPGSTIGNLTPDKAGELLRFMSDMLGPQGGLLIGIDLQKDVSVVEAAYNDAAGVTAEFSLNLLARINRELGGNFELRDFEHRAIYNAVDHRIEITLVSLRDQEATVGGHRFRFEAGEETLIEYSHKYTVDGFAAFASDFGFTLHKYWTDEREYFGVLHLVLDES